MNSAKKHIVLAITLAEPGGVTSFVLGFAKWLKNQGHEITVVAGEGDWLFNACTKEGIQTRRLRHLKRAILPWHDTLAYFELRKLYRELKPDAIHLNSTKMGIIGSLAARHANIPKIVYRIGGWTFLEPLPAPVKWFYRLAEQISARWKDIIVCVHPGDEAVAREQDIRPREALVTVPNGIDLAPFDAKLLPRDVARQELNIDPATFVFGTIAHLYPAKDLPRYVKTCALVHKRLPNARFLILGEGMERARIEQEIEQHNLKEVFRLPGAKGHASHFLRAFDTFVLPSNKEGMSWALLEAMAASCPCVATDVGANKWLMGNVAGWLVPPQNSSLLADAMVEAAMKPEEAKTRAERARQIIAQRFPLEKTYQGNADRLISSLGR